MAIVETIRVGGDKRSASNDGKVVINQTSGEIIVRDRANTRRFYLGSEKSPTGFGEYISDPGVDVVTELLS